MSVEEKLREIHKEIQQNLTRMIPERYRKICLYASVLDENELTSGEMFFYYFPNGILKKNPINVYEIPELFDFDGEKYRVLENRLYESIKNLRKYCVTIGKTPWSNVTITMGGTKYIAEYNYDDLSVSEFSNYERHIIWRYKYLRVPIESYTKKEREILQRYFDSDEYKSAKISRYEENVYEKQVNKFTVYSTVDSHEEYAEKEVAEVSGTQNQLLNF